MNRHEQGVYPPGWRLALSGLERLNPGGADTRRRPQNACRHGTRRASTWRWNTSERDDFLSWVRSRLNDAEVALHNGDAGPRLAIWSTGEPITVFGAWKSGNGHQEVRGIFQALEDAFSDCTSYAQDIIAAEVNGDMAYTVGYEHTQAAINGEPRTYSLRVTQVYRREEGEWKVAHRHADTLPPQEPEES